MKKMFVLLWPLWVGAGLTFFILVIGWAVGEIVNRPLVSTPARSTSYNVVVISGCEYIERPGYHYFLIHKANCTNSIHGHE